MLGARRYSHSNSKKRYSNSLPKDRKSYHYSNSHQREEGANFLQYSLKSFKLSFVLL